MSSTFSVSTESLRSSSTDVHRISGDVESSVAAMMGRLVSLQDAWSGTASASFQDLIVRWRATQTQVKESLDEIALALQEAGEAYDQAEAANNRLLQGRA